MNRERSSELNGKSFAQIKKSLISIEIFYLDDKRDA